MKPTHTLRRASVALFGLLFAAASILAACFSPAPPRPQTAPQPAATREPLTLTVVHTNDTWGYLLPCG